MIAGILDVPKEMCRVDPTTFRWFVKGLGKHRTIEFSNGTAHYSDDEQFVAAMLNAKVPMYYIRTKKSRRAK